MSTLAVKVVLDTRRALIKNAGSKDPIYPIKLRVTFARKQRYYLEKMGFEATTS